jgi:hypothetical protein
MRLALALLVMLCAAAADATTCDVTEFSASGTLTAERLNQRIRQVEACMNGALGNTNLTSTDPIAVAKLATPNAILSQSFRLEDEDGDGTAGEDVGPLATTLAKWRIPVTGTVIGWSAALRCPAATDPGCNLSGQNATVTLKVNGIAVSQFTGLATTTTQTSFALSTALNNTTDITLEVSGTVTNVKFVDVVVYEKASLQT